MLRRSLADAIQRFVAAQEQLAVADRGCAVELAVVAFDLVACE